MPLKPPEIQIPQKDRGEVSFDEYRKGTDSRFEKNEILIYSVLVVVGLTAIATAVGVSAMVLDQLHFNNEFYRDKTINHTLTTEKFVNTQPPTPQDPLENLR